MLDGGGKEKKREGVWKIWKDEGGLFLTYLLE